MTNNSELPQPYGATYDDEISISELLMKLWAKRGVILALPLVLAGLTVVGLLAGKTVQQSTVGYFIELNGIQVQKVTSKDDFGRQAPGSSNNNNNNNNNNNEMLADQLVAYYPNGTVFSPQDLLNPSVLLKLGEETDIEPIQLAEAISVDFGTPISSGLLEEYRAALSENSKASSQDLALINTRYQSKLDSASKRGLKISVNVLKLKISESQGIMIAEKLPEIWSNVFSTQFNTTLNTEIARLPAVLRQDLSTTTGLQEVDVQLASIMKGAELMNEDGRLRGLLNDREATPGDLLQSAKNFRAFYFEPLYQVTFEGRNSLSLVYQQDLSLQIDKITAEIAELNVRLENIKDFQNSGRTSGRPAGSGNQASLDGSALTEVVGLAERAGLSSYLQATLDQRFELRKAQADLETQLRRINQESIPTSGSVISAEFKDTARQRYLQLVEDYAGLIEKAKALLRQQTPRFYSPTVQPSTSTNLIEKRDFLFIALALALGGMLAIVAALLWPARENP